MRRPRSRPAAAATPPCRRARPARCVQHDYKRRGALAYLAAWDVHRGQVTGRCEHATGITPFSRLVRQVMTAEPYASADRVSWIAGNGSSHRGAASIKRMTRAWPNAHLIHLPVHASWLDQAEIYFSVIQRKVISPNDFTSLDQIRDRLATFEIRYNTIARPSCTTPSTRPTTGCGSASMPTASPMSVRLSFTCGPPMTVTFATYLDAFERIWTGALPLQ